jgi:hypothetical protein
MDDPEVRPRLLAEMSENLDAGSISAMLFSSLLELRRTYLQTTHQISAILCHFLPCQFCLHLSAPLMTAASPARSAQFSSCAAPWPKRHRYTCGGRAAFLLGMATQAFFWSSRIRKARASCEKHKWKFPGVGCDAAPNAQ